MRDFQQPGRSAVYAPGGMAATSHPLSTQVAIDVLKEGGNALDAAIAACAVQCVVEPQSTGIGGDCFCLYAPHNRDDVVAFNGSGKAPGAATLDKLQSLGVSSLARPSAHSVVVPGAIDAWVQLNQDHGRMPLSALLQPAIEYASKGYPISPRVHRDIGKQQELFAACDTLRGIFAADGEVMPVGTLHRQPALANTLSAIAKEGRNAFYRGDVTVEMVKTLREQGGLHTLEDFANVKGDYVTPISTEFRGHTVYECPPNGQGLIALLLLNIMSGYKADAPLLSAERIHLEIEACRQAYRTRGNYLADPAFSDVPVSEILSAAYAEKLREAIDPQKATIPPREVELPRHKDTVYISVVDKDRNACSFINTLFWPFGSGIADKKTGVIFTNRAEGFSLDPQSPNCIAPGKRPLHTIIPGLLKKDGKVMMSFGVMGGEYQAMGHMQFLTRVLDYGLDLQQAQDAPRFMADPFTGVVEVEAGVPEDVRDQLRSMGHEIVAADGPIGGSQAIAIDRDQGVLSGGSDPRKDGCAIGY